MAIPRPLIFCFREYFIDSGKKGRVVLFGYPSTSDLDSRWPPKTPSNILLVCRGNSGVRSLRGISLIGVMSAQMAE